MNKTVSILILVKDGAHYLEDLIRALAAQDCPQNIELVVVDSGSTDGSVELLKALCGQHQIDLNLTVIEPGKFGHGSTRNLAVRKARGDVVATLSQDALPIADNWLAEMIGPLTDDSVAGVFGRQVPKPDTNLCEALFYAMTYPEERRRMVGGDRSSFSNRSLFFSNVNGALRKSLALAYPFREDLVMSEDQLWGRAVLQEGYAIVYEPAAAAFHSHNYSLSELFKRFFKSGYSLRQMNMSGDLLLGGARTTATLLWKVFSVNPVRFPYALLYEAVQATGFLCGKYDLLPRSIREVLLKW